MGQEGRLVCVVDGMQKGYPKLAKSVRTSSRVKEDARASLTCEPRRHVPRLCSCAEREYATMTHLRTRSLPPGAAGPGLRGGQDHYPRVSLRRGQGGAAPGACRRAGGPQG